MTRKRWWLVAAALVGIGYIVLPTYLGLSELTTDVIFSVLFGGVLSLIIYEDHRLANLKADLWLVCGFVFGFTLLATLALLAAGYRFQIMIPISMVLGGVAYWHLDRLAKRPR